LIEPLLEVTDLCVGYGKVEAVHHASLTILPGQIVTVIGPNGAGKTSLLGAIMGLLPRTRGRVRFRGTVRSGASAEVMVGEGLGLVPETRELFGAMTVKDNLILGHYSRRKLGHSDLVEGLEEMYRLFPKLKERFEQQASTLSGGERQMLALGRALMARPKLLMLDEPSLGLAPLIVREIFRLIERLREGGVSILLVEQNARAALRLADYAYVMESGEVALEGAASDLANDPAVIETYLGLGARPS
jgi:branched-chain amino acid transport system ATP-binding protein